MMIELQATYFALKKWNQNPEATKKQIGIWQHWKEETEGNHRPLSEVEVNRMKAFEIGARVHTSRWQTGKALL